ncbi:hypothetical protein PLICRDRAFT_51332 [Plicaturopsis crispa FD-325 SS-3]|nr:hypothetical protein PLICRDRAFT_51332 [Plicaturopsis crispa FD-325 SS-3]
MPTPFFLFNFCLTGVVAFILINVFRRGKGPGAPLPPGPRRYPVIGNMFDIPTYKPWLTFTQWGTNYGPLVYAKVLGRSMVIINSWEVAADMLDKKSLIYSDRPVLPMTGELMGWRDSFVFYRYGARLRRARKQFHQTLGPRNVKQFQPLEERETRGFLQRVLAKPDGLGMHVRHVTGAVILMVSHGYEVKASEDELVLLADDVVDKFSLSLRPGAFLVDVLPILQYVPDWFPFAGFKRKAKMWNTSLNEMVDKPFEYVKQQMAAGTAIPSFASGLLDSSADLSEEELYDDKWTALTVYAGGSDTTVSAIYSIFLAMTLFPEVQKKAQEELDTVIGSDRLPEFADRERLPYVNALALEVLRWNVVAPLSVAHRLTEDDIHDGYFIPRGAVVIANVYSMLRDPKTYPDPEIFDPTRFIPSEGIEIQKDPRSIAFGFGRRICPGMHLAEDSLFIACAMSLAVFDITKAVENGIVVEPIVDMTQGNISHPVPFKCSIKPRSEKAKALILAG